MKLVRKNEPHSVVVSSLSRANTFVSRLVGLIGKTSFHEDEGLLFSKTNSIHMWMMRVSIDAVFLRSADSSSWMVTSIHSNLKPWKILPVTDFKANDVLELPSGTAQRVGLKVGEVLCIAS